MARPINIVLVVVGGVLQAAYTTGKHPVTYRVIDLDNLEEATPDDLGRPAYFGSATMHDDLVADVFATNTVGEEAVAFAKHFDL